MKRFPNNKTKVFISVSKFPGNTGSIFHNSLFNYFKINSIYIPFRLNNAKNLNKIILDLNISGCSVSMPFKVKVFKYLNKYDKSCRITRNVNTILRKNGKLVGFNTDYIASNKILDNKIKNFQNCLLLGNGAVAKTFYKALKKKKNCKVLLCSRKKTYKGWNLDLNDKIISWNSRNLIKADLLVNATPLGMIRKNVLPVNEGKLKNFKNIIDLPINFESKLKQKCKKLNINYIAGSEFAFFQALEQFKIYSNRKKISYKLAKKLIKHSK